MIDGDSRIIILGTCSLMPCDFSYEVLGTKNLIEKYPHSMVFNEV